MKISTPFLFFCQQVLSEKLVASSSDKPQGPQNPLENKLEEIWGKKAPNTQIPRFFLCYPPENLYFYKAPRYYQWSDLEFLGLQSVKHFFLLSTCTSVYFPRKSRLSGWFWSHFQECSPQEVPSSGWLIQASFHEDLVEERILRDCASSVTS